MALGGLKVLPSKLVILFLIVLYLRNLVAIVDKKQPELQGDSLLRDGDGDLFQFESLSAALSGESNGLNVISNLASSVPINFDPPLLEFSEQPIGMAHTREIKISNPTHSLTLQLVSISGNQPDFHSSFFISKVLRPGESTTFEIVFLPRSVGPVEDTLLIQSSFGTYKYQINGSGIPNIFRLRPLRGARIPINATYSPSISFYNPYNRPLQIVELYSSGGSLHIELPHGFTEGNKTVWEIRPYETKQIAKASFVGEYISNHTAFIRIKTNHTSDPSIVLPVEVEVSEASGLFLSRELLDFGTIKSGGQGKLPLYVLNAGPHPVEIKSITPDPENPSIKVEYANTTLKPGNKYTKVAVLVFSVGPHPQTTDLDTSGIIKIWAEDKASFHQLTVPYEAQVLPGILDYDPEDILFRAHDPPFSPILRSISLQNKFSFPVVIYSAKLSTKAQEIFSVDEFHTPYILQPDGQWHKPIRLRFHLHSSDCLLNTTLRLATNASFFNIPLLCYDGSLEYDFGGKEIDSLEFGLMSERDSLSKIFTITNPNPVTVSVTSLQVNDNSNLPYVAVHLLSLPPQPKEILADGLKKGRRPPYYIHSGRQMVFSVNVTRPKKPGKFSGELLLYSSLGKVVTVPVNYQAVIGGMSISPNHIKLKPVFPYSTSSVRVHIKSTYTKPIKLLSFNVSPNDSHLISPFVITSASPVIHPSTTTVIGKVLLNPLVLWPEFNTSYILEDIYDGTELNRDVQHFVSLWEAWDVLTSNRTIETFDFTVFVDSEIDKGMNVTGTAHLIWPGLTDDSSQALQFPLTLVGNTSELSFSIFNPSSQPLQVELIFLNSVIDADYIFQILSDKFNIDASFYMNSSPNGGYTIKKKNYQHLYQDRVTSYKKFPKFILPPHGNQSLEMEFSPVSDQPSNGLLLLRNNLTVFDYIKLEGTASRSFVTVGGVYPGGSASLHFKYTEAMMEACSNIDCECGLSQTDLSYSKSFVIRNSGPVPMTVAASLGNRGRCEDRGFLLESCDKPFTLYPNRTRKLEITCIPDYTLSRITGSLRLTAPFSPPMDFPMLATLPHNMLSTCYSSLSRSDLENLSATVSVPLWLLALLVMIIATVFQVNWHTRQLHHKLNTPTGKDVPVQATGGLVFDLSSIARRVTTSISDKVTQLAKNVEDNDSCVVDSIPANDGVENYPVSPPLTTPISATPSSVTETINQEEKIDFKPMTTSVITCPPESEPLLSTPMYKSKAKRTCMKVEKSQNLSSSSSTSNLTDDTDGCGPVVHVVKMDHLSRKESDDSIPESDQDHSGSSSHSSEQYSYTPDPEDATPTNRILTNDKIKPSFTKEPGTGQTVLVKDGINEENENYSGPATVDKGKQSSIVSVSINVKPRGRSKKQKAQLKREEKLKKKRKEREDAIFAKKVTEPSECCHDKESTSSSTDNLEEEHATSQRTVSENESLKKPSQSTTAKVSESKREKTERQKLPTNEDPSDYTENDIETTVISSSPVPSEQIPLLEDEEDTNYLEMETSCSSIEFKTLGLSPSPDDLTVSTDTPVPPSPVSRSMSDTLKISTKRATSKAVSQPSSPEFKPKTSFSVPSTPGKASDKARPSKLDLHEPSTDSHSTLSSVETDGISDKSKGRLAPHELAASLLKNIARPAKQKEDKTKQENNTEDINSPPSRSKKKSIEVKATMTGGGGGDKRTTPLSSDAMPFYPLYPGHPHPSHMPHGPPPPPPQPFPPPIRAPLRAPSYPPPHHPPYDYPMVRPMMYPPHVDDSVSQFERKQRKRSDHKYPSKAFSPPFPDEHCHEKPRPFHGMPNHEEWMGSHGSHMTPLGFPPEEDPFAMSYPVGSRRSGAVYPRGYPYGSDQPHPRSTSMEVSDPAWDPNQLTQEEVMYLKELRRRQYLKKMREKQQKLGEPYDQYPTDPYSLANLRERDLDSSSRFSRHSNSSYRLETDMVSETMLNSYHRAFEESRQRKLSREEPSYPWPSASLAAPGSLNRAPGPPGSFPLDTVSREDPLSEPHPSLFDKTSSSDGWRNSSQQMTEGTNKSPTLPSSRDGDNTAWHSLWTMQTPLLSALEEQRQQAAKSTDHGSYDLFEGSHRSIWSLNKNDSTFSWITNTSDDEKD